MSSTNIVTTVCPVVGTPQQEAIWKFAVNGSEHCLVDARAGSGKTVSTVVEAIARVSPKLRVAALAFNKHIANELNAQLDRRNCRFARALTFHSLGFAAIRRVYPNIQLVEDKLRLIIKNYVPGDPDMAAAVAQLVRLCKNGLIDGRDLKALQRLADYHAIRLPELREEATLRLVSVVLDECLERDSVIDYDDQIWWPVQRNLPLDQFDMIFVDEAQDTNRAQQDLLLRACPKGRIFIVIDRYQSVYGFRGADADAILSLLERLSQTPRGCKQFPLTVTRRCPKSHVRLAQGLVPDLEALPDAPEGEIIVVSKDLAVEMMEPKDLVICRVNRYLVPVAYALTKRGVKVIIRGKDFGQGLLRLVEGLGGEDVADLLKRLTKYYEKESRKLMALGERGAPLLAHLEDQVGCVIALCSGITEIPDLCGNINRIFAEVDDDGKPRDFVLLGTIHRTKGLEAANVFVLEPGLIPHPRAKREWQQQQERNLAYIAATRAKFTSTEPGRLFFVGAVPEIYGAAELSAPPECADDVTLNPPALGRTISLELESFVDE